MPRISSEKPVPNPNVVLDTLRIATKCASAVWRMFSNTMVFWIPNANQSTWARKTCAEAPWRRVWSASPNNLCLSLFLYGFWCVTEKPPTHPNFSSSTGIQGAKDALSDTCSMPRVATSVRQADLFSSPHKLATAPNVLTTRVATKASCCPPEVSRCVTQQKHTNHYQSKNKQEGRLALGLDSSRWNSARPIE